MGVVRGVKTLIFLMVKKNLQIINTDTDKLISGYIPVENYIYRI